MDFLVELFFEIIVSVYAELMGMIIPEEKSNNKRACREMARPCFLYEKFKFQFIASFIS